MPDRRAADPQEDLLRPRGPELLHFRPRGRAADDRVVHHHDPLVRDDVGDHVELQPHRGVPLLLGGLDEGPAHVAVGDDSLAVRDAAGGRVAGRGRAARVGHGHHEIGRHRGLARELGPHGLADALDVLAEDDAGGVGEIDVLKDAVGRALGHGRETPAGDPPVVQGHDLPRLDLADVLGAEHVQGDRLAGHDRVAVGRPAQH